MVGLWPSVLEFSMSVSKCAALGLVVLVPLALPRAQSSAAATGLELGARRADAE